MATVFLRQWLNRMGGAGRRAGRQVNRIKLHCCLRLEPLEGRCLPSTVMNLSDHDPGSLRQAILDTPSGGTVDFEPGLTGTIPLSTGELMIAKDLTITGPGAGVITVSGNHSSRVFNIAATFTVEISGLTIADGRVTGTAANGGGIFNAGKLTLTDSTVSSNYASDIASHANGSGIFNAGTLMVTNSTVSGNVGSPCFGGGIYNSGTLTVTDSTLSGNFIAYDPGGGIFNDRGGTLTVTNSTLSGNEGGGGGGIANYGGTLTVTNSTLRGNRGPYVGGGILNSGGTLTVTNSTLSDNHSDMAGGSGGGIAAGGTVTVTSSTLSDNSAYDGGGGIDNAGTLTITNSTLSGNSAFVGGGGIDNGLYGATTATATVTSSTISGNSARSSGGGIENYGTLTVTDSTLSGNHSDYAGGGGIDNGGTLTITNSTLSGNHSDYAGDGIITGGGGILNRRTLTITNSTLSGNSASEGGGIFNYYTVTVTNSTLSGNRASGSQTAGGIANISLSSFNATVQLLNSTISGNTATSTDLTGNQLFSGVRLGTGSADIQFRNTIIAGDGSRPDFFSVGGGTFTSGGHNLVRDGTGGGPFADTDLVGTTDFPIDPQLEPLGDYGGPTQTMRPLPGSPVVASGDNTDAPDTDQRGFPRIVLGFIDIGSVELQPDEFGDPGGNTPSQSTFPAAAIAAVLLAPDTTRGHLGNDPIHDNRDSTGYGRAMAGSPLFSEGQDQALINRLALFHSHQRSCSWPLVNIDSSVAEGAN
jgi:hypothetical protein